MQFFSLNILLALLALARGYDAGPLRIIITTPQRCGSHHLNRLILSGFGEIKSVGEHPMYDLSVEACWSELVVQLRGSLTVILHHTGWCRDTHTKRDKVEEMGAKLRNHKNIKVIN